MRKSVVLPLLLVLVCSAASVAQEAIEKRPPFAILGHQLGQSEAEAQKASEAINFFNFRCGNMGADRICTSSAFGAPSSGPSMSMTFSEGKLSNIVYTFWRFKFKEVRDALADKYGAPSEPKVKKKGHTFWKSADSTLMLEERDSNDPDYSSVAIMSDKPLSKAPAI